MADPKRQQRIFLVVVDETEEMSVALQYASRRARNSGGRVAILYVIQPVEMQYIGSIEELMRQEQRTEAEQLLLRLAREVFDLSGFMPCLYIREGDRQAELVRLLQEEPISILVLAAGSGSGGPGPLITSLVGRFSATIKVPVTIVPGTLTLGQLDAIT